MFIGPSLRQPAASPHSAAPAAGLPVRAAPARPSLPRQERSPRGRPGARRKGGVLPLEGSPPPVGVFHRLVGIRHRAQELNHRPILLADVLVQRHVASTNPVAPVRYPSGVYA